MKAAKFAILATIVAAQACEQPPRMTEPEINDRMANSQFLLGERWRYDVRQDRIRNFQRLRADLRSRDGTATLTLQMVEGGLPPMVYFRSAGDVRCADSCTIEHSFDGRRGRWRAHAADAETLLLSEADGVEALQSLRSARQLIAELPLLDHSPQVEFAVAGLEWPQSAASDGGND